MQIIIETPLSEDDKNVLRALVGDTVVVAVDPATPAPEPEPEPEPAPAKPKKPAPKKPAPKPEPEPEPEEEEEEAGEVDLQAVLAVASEVINAGKAEDLQSLLADFGAGQVSKLAENQYADFIEGLKAL